MSLSLLLPGPVQVGDRIRTSAWGILVVDELPEASDQRQLYRLHDAVLPRERYLWDARSLHKHLGRRPTYLTRNAA
jgi:hypothetical protein